MNSMLAPGNTVKGLTVYEIGLQCKNRKILSEFLPGNSFAKNSVKSGVHSRLTIYTS